MKKLSIKGFTLIELLMVIAIIAILAGILIPSIGAVRKQANIAASKSQLSQYVNAIQLFKGEYNFFPTFGQSPSGESYEISLANDSTEFVETLSGRDTDGNKTTTGGNRRQIGFHSFSETEFYLQADDTIDDTQLADRFNNTNLKIVIDGDGNGIVKPSPNSNELSVPSAGVRAEVTAYADENLEEKTPTYSLWN